MYTRVCMYSKHKGIVNYYQYKFFVLKRAFFTTATKIFIKNVCEWNKQHICMHFRFVCESFGGENQARRKEKKIWMKVTTFAGKKRQTNTVWCTENHIWTGLKTVDACERELERAIVCVRGRLYWWIMVVCANRLLSTERIPIHCAYPIHIHTRIIFWLCAFFSFLSLVLMLLLRSAQWAAFECFCVYWWFGFGTRVLPFRIWFLFFYGRHIFGIKG